FSVVGATVLGGALAWQASWTVQDQQVDIGNLSFTADFEPSADALLGPDGATSTVGIITVDNTGDFNMLWNSGTVIAKNLDAAHANCDVANFTGAVTPLNSFDVQPIGPGDILDPAARVEITVKSGAPA